MEIFLKQNIKNLIENHEVVDSDKWQSISIDKRNPIVSIFNLSDLFLVPETKEELQTLCSPDLPWAEDHFLERVNGLPINPGEEYKNWPYYKKDQDDSRFRKTGKFSHNYMERYWCKGLMGRRFEYGDLSDIIERIKKDKNTRQAYLSVWHPEDQSESEERVPCTLGYWFYFRDGKLNCSYFIRSCDAARHFKNDIYMTARLLQFVAEKTNLQVGELYYWIGSFHCFQSDLYSLKKLIK